MTVNSDAAIALAAQFGADLGPASNLQSPAVPEALGREIAARFADVELVIAPDNVDDAVLAHVVARELAAELAFAWSDEGLLGLTRESAPNTRTLLVGYDWANYPGVGAIAELARGGSLDLVGVVSVFDPDAADGLQPPVTILA